MAKYIFQIEAASYEDLLEQCKAELNRLALEPEPRRETETPQSERHLLPGFHSALGQLIGEYSTRLLRYICEEIDAGREPNSSGFKSLVGREGQDGRWIGGPTAAVNRLLHAYAVERVQSHYNENGAAAWSLSIGVARQVLTELNRRAAP